MFFLSLHGSNSGLLSALTAVSTDFVSSFINLLIMFVIILLFMLVVKLVYSVKSTTFFRARQAYRMSASTEASGSGSAVSSDDSRCEVKLYNVPEKTAAMLMAIIAYETDIPLDELRFISIKEV